MFKLIIAVLCVCGLLTAETLYLNNDNNINMRGEINGDSINKLQMELAEKVQKRGKANYPIYISIDSGGGAIDAGISFIEYAKTINNLHTITLFGASMASGIQQALPGKRYVLGTSITMYHRASGGFQGQFADGEVESRLNMAKELVGILENQNAYRLKMSLANYKQLTKDEYWIVGGQSHMLKNAADEVVSISCSNELISSHSIENFQVFIFTISMKFSACPLFRSGSIVKGEEAYLQNKAAFNKKMTGVYYNQNGQ